MKRRLFTIFAALSLLLCLATVALWVRSYYRFDVYSNAQSWISLSGLLIITNPTIFDLEGKFSKDAESFTGHLLQAVLEGTFESRGWSSTATVGRFLGFGYHVSDNNGVTVRAFAVPHWFIGLLFAMIPGWWLVGTIRSRGRHREGHCQRCGYDLRATPDCCPECGNIPVKI